ncbi:MAG: hypothetical protein KJ672_04210 [Candidatus Thermoplasmatota archaeon]|nr:hypothetical protein [Candidatus Thermoplasmatota archaeon]
MTRTFIRVELAGEGESPKQVIERMRRVGAVPIIGDYDFELSLDDDERLFDKLEEIHHALRGANVRYTVTTLTGAEAAILTKSRHEITHYANQKPIELRKSLYKAKLDRWREMGLDVAELETLLDSDLYHFKIVSREFLRTHLDRISLVTDRKPESQVDGEVLAQLDEEGKKMAEIRGATGLSEDQVTVALGRLISAGCVVRTKRDSKEIFVLVPPPAPNVRKTLKVVPASDEQDAESRVYYAVPVDGISAKDLLRAAQLPRAQFKIAVAKLTEDNKIRRDHKGKMEFYYRV